MKIFLIGYMGSGKSSCGKKLAEKLKMDFADLDRYIEETSGKTISELFRTEGEERFREIEYNSLKHFLEQDNLVLATGGGTPYHYDSMDLMNRSGVTIYLKMSPELLAQRLADEPDKRPLVSGMNKGELQQFITVNLEKREDYYLRANYKVKAKNLDIGELAEFITKETVK